MHFIGIDIGTSTICGVLYSLSANRQEVLTIENNANIVTGNSWEKIQDPEKIFNNVKKIVEEFLEKHHDIKGIGLTGQMHGIVYVDNRGKCLSDLINWQDGRGNQIYEDNISYAAWLTKKTGYKVSTGFGLVSHFYNLKNNLVPKSAWKICTIMDYVTMRLTGNKDPLTNVTNAASLGFFNLEKMQFDLRILEKISVHTNILPGITNSFDPCGSYRNIPVYIPIGDNQAGFLGSVNHPQKSILINIGTSGQISAYSNKYFESDYLDLRPFPGGGYISVGASLCGGSSFNILKSFFDRTFELFAKSPVEYDFFKMVNSLDTIEYNLDPLIIETLFEGKRTAPDIRGSIKNISALNLTPSNLIIGFYKGVCEELYEFYNRFPETLREKNLSIIGSGNALRKNKLLQKLLEERFQQQLIVPCHNEEAAFGACLCAIIGGKYADNVMEAGKYIKYNVRDEEYITI